MDELLEGIREWVKHELAEWDKAARQREEEAANALDQKLETVKAEIVKTQLPWWHDSSPLQGEPTKASEQKTEAIDSHSPVTADVLRSCGIDLVNEKTPMGQVRSDGDRLQVTLDELVVLLRTPTAKLKDFAPLADPRKAEMLLTKNPALYRVIRELAKRAITSEKPR